MKRGNEARKTELQSLSTALFPEIPGFDRICRTPYCGYLLGNELITLLIASGFKDKRFCWL